MRQVMIPAAQLIEDGVFLRGPRAARPVGWERSASAMAPASAQPAKLRVLNAA